MRPEERDPAYLWDMLEAAREVEAMLNGRPLETFLSDRILLRAIERGVELIGEAARRISSSYQAAHPEIPWRRVMGQPNILAHEYGRIDHALLYRTAVEDVPELIARLQALLPPLDESES
jgi:uncharacterized protein with HEPN domain